ncbi:MAG: DUF2219 family protein [Alphaproteobacteria bacterium]|nr:DUF2219 family protein [Alphaproteobacteria bacterium]
MGTQRRSRLAASLAALALCALAPSALAGNYTAQFENDRIADTDRHYTTGMRVNWVSDRATDSPLWAKNLLDKIYPLADLRAGRVGLALGHNIFTPEDTATSSLLVDDRPYAGWLYGGISAHAETSRTIAGRTVDTLDTVELDIGVVGPWALAEEVQNNFHELINVSRSNGWHHQLENEPALLFVAERRWRPAPLTLGATEADIIPHMGLSLGNVMTLANAGATLRFGQDLDVDFGPPHVRPTLSGLAAVSGGTDFAWYLFAGAEGRIVARNIFLDGNTFANSHSVDKIPLVADIQTGAAIVVNDIRLAFTHVFRTREFEGQRRADRYGAVSLSARF